MKLPPRNLLYGYAFIGALAFAIDTSASLVLAEWMHYVAANSAGFLTAFAFNYAAGHRYVFRRSFSRQEIAASLPPVLMISLAGLGLSDLLIILFHGVMNFSLLPAKIMTASLAMVFNLGARLYLVYGSSLDD